VYVSRLAGKYATSAYVLAPFLLIVSYLLLTVVYPRAAIWFDRNPKQIKLSEDRRHLEVQNENGNTLWSLEYWPLGGFLEDGKWLLSSIDEDPFNEVILVFDVQAGDPRWLPAHIYAFDDDAGMMWNSPAVNVGEYIGDSSATNPYKTYISVCPHNENNLILSRAVESSPSRTHISLFSNDGRKIGWYINQGTVGVKVFSNQIDNSRAIIMGHGFNNRTKTGVIFSLDPDNMYGVSPPYDFIDGYDLSWLRRGSQKHYVTLERTELNKKIRKNPYNYVFQLELYENMSFTAMTQEIDSIESGLLYSFDEFFRVQNVTSDDYFIETIRQFAESGMTPFASRDSLSELQKNLVRYWTDSGWVSEQMLSLMFEQKSR
jgi:hypothetical protein